MPAAGMLGSAIGAEAPTAVANGGVRGRLTPLKDLKGKQSPEQLKRLVAQISEKPESVQHHTVDQDGLESLLEQLARNPAPRGHRPKAARPKSCRRICIALGDNLFNSKKRMRDEDATSALGVCTAFGLAAPAYADPDDVSGDDAGFLSALQKVGIHYPSPAQAITAGNRCADA